MLVTLNGLVMPCVNLPFLLPAPARGTSAATESITTTSIAPVRDKVSAISKACSPESGCDKIDHRH